MTGYVTLYLDESGEKTWPPPWGRSNHSVYALAGVILNPLQDKIAHERIPLILTNFFPNETLRPTELHYGDLINERPPYDTVEREDRRAIADAVFQLIEQLRPVLMGSVVLKKRMKEKYGPGAFPPNEYALRATIERFDRHLEETQQLGMALMDTEGLNADSALREMVHQARSYGIKVGGINYMPRSDRKLSFVLNSVGFSPSQMSPGIQLADFVAYALFSAHERNRRNRLEQLGPFWRKVGNFSEPSVIPR